MDRRRFLSTAVAGMTAATVGSTMVTSAVASSHGLMAAGDAWPIRNTESFVFESKAVGDSMAVGVWQPPQAMLAQFGSDTGQKMDLVYVLDGSFALGLVSAICMLQLVDLVKPGFPPLLLVGLDYLQDKPNARTRDYTHSDLAVPLAPGELPAEQTIGGADKFLQFLEQELDPAIRAKYPVADKPAGILGDSYGGTFTFHAFRRQSKLFDKYFLGSPGLFTTGVDYVGEIKKLLQGKLAHDTSMYLTFGALEMNGGIGFYEDMGVNYNKLVSVLHATPNEQLKFHSKIYPDHTHTTIAAPAFNDALLYLYGPHLPRG